MKDEIKVQIHEDYCQNASSEDIAAILERISAILSASYARQTDSDAPLEDAS